MSKRYPLPQKMVPARRRPNTQLRQQRLCKNWTQVYVATMIGTSDTEISRWENGRATPSLYFRERLCELFQAAPEALGLLSTSDLKPSVPDLASPASLPLPLTTLIGRDDDLAHLCAQLQLSDRRLITLIGPGGVGKTRIALAVARQMQAGCISPVYFISLAACTTVARVLPTLLEALHIQETEMQDSLQCLKQALAPHQALLVLDNFEQIVQAAPLLTEILAACPQVRILVTSRTALHVRGERLYRVEPLSLPDPCGPCSGEDYLASEAVQLFVERVQEREPSFCVNEETLPLVAEVCRRLNGLPLAIELAAARLNVFSLPTLLERLNHRLHILTHGPQDLPERQRTLRNTLQWSYDLLSPSEQRLFRWLSVFVGGCTLQAVDYLSPLLGEEASVGIDTLASLVEKQFLVRIQQGEAEPRFVMLETMREYAWELQQACEETERIQRVHAQYCVALAEEAEAHLFHAEQGAWFERLEREYENVRAALAWSLKNREDYSRVELAARLAGALVGFWVVRWSLREGRAWLERLLPYRSALSPQYWLKISLGYAWLAFHEGDIEQAEDLYQITMGPDQQVQEKKLLTHHVFSSPWLLGRVALTSSNESLLSPLVQECRLWTQQTGDQRSLASALLFLALPCIERGDYVRACTLLHESRSVFELLDEKENVAWVYLHLGRASFALGERTRAQEWIQRGLSISQTASYTVATACGLYLLGRFAFAGTDFSKARALLEKSLQMFHTLEDRRAMAHVLSYLAQVALIQQDEEQAQTLCMQSIQLFQQVHDREGIVYALRAWGGLVASPIWSARLFGAAETLSENLVRHTSLLLPFERTCAEREAYQCNLQQLRAANEEQRIADAFAQGQQLSPEQVLTLKDRPLVSGSIACGQRLLSQPREPRSRHHQDLTRREQEIFALVSRGLTNAQIAESLGISVRTVDAHIRSIYSKLQVASRHAAIRYALDHHLV